MSKAAKNVTIVVATVIVALLVVWFVLSHTFIYGYKMNPNGSMDYTVSATMQQYLTEKLNERNSYSNLNGYLNGCDYVNYTFKI